MTIVDPKWGAELMTTKGKIHKFDVVECMIAYANTILKPNEIKRYWTINFLKPKEFIDATTAIYIRTLQYPSPMGLNSLAIESLADTTKLKLQPGYEILNWKDVIEKAKEEYLH
jgi:copper chaperone NosL